MKWQPYRSNRLISMSMADILHITNTTYIMVMWHWHNTWFALTHWSPDEINNISQTTFWNVFFSMKMFEFRLKFNWIFFPKGPINNIPALVQIMAWRCPGDKPLSETMMVSLPTHICVTRPQWVNTKKSCSIEIFEFWMRFQWNMFLRVQLMINKSVRFQCWEMMEIKNGLLYAS